MTYLTGTGRQTWRPFADQLSANNPQRFMVVPFSLPSLVSSGSHIVIFAESPASLIAESSEDPRLMLDGWKHSASALLGLWRRNRHRTSILNWDECVADATSLEEWLSSHLQTIPGTAAALLPAPQYSLAEKVLADAFVARDRDAARLWREYQAASQKIAKDATFLMPPSALCALNELKMRAHHTADKHRTDAARIANLEAERSDLLTHHKTLSNKCEDLSHDLASLRNELAEQQEVRLRTQDLLLQEISNAHKESEEFFTKWQHHYLLARPRYLSMRQIVSACEVANSPYLHADYIFHDVMFFETCRGDMLVRLVEHHGNAGLCVFKSFGRGLAPLSHWQPSGSENGLDFMLFVPQNRQAAAQLASATSSDLLLIHELVVCLVEHSSIHGELKSDFWHHLAKRLLQEIGEIPERLHYDSVAGSVDRTERTATISFTAANLYFRGKCALSYFIQWTPSSSGGTVCISGDKNGVRMLLASEKDLTVSFETTANSASLQTLWPRLTQHDRTFLLLLAKALPDFVFHLCEQHPDQKADKDRLTKQARTLFRRLRALDRRHKLRSAIAKLVRR
jgi:hypothetical protein